MDELMSKTICNDTFTVLGTLKILS
jgi:hypothetical protein